MSRDSIAAAIDTTSRAEKRAAIDAALLAGPTRSDREIARALGVDHKTVSCRRVEIENPQVGKLADGNPQIELSISPVGNLDGGISPTREEVGKFGSEISQAISPLPDVGPTREELLLQSLPSGIDPEAPAFKADLAKVEKIAAEEAAREKLGIHQEPEEIPLLLRQDEITIAHDERLGEWIIRQKNWPDEDDEIRILDERIWEFVEQLTDILGVPTFGGPKPG